jgi:hypothetical protein
MMDRELIHSAVRVLAIEAVYLKNSRVHCKEGFFPQFVEEELSLVPQYKSGSMGKLVTADFASNEVAPKLILLDYAAGVRLVDGDTLATLEQGEGPPEEAQYLEIEAEFCAQYRLDPSADLEAHRPAIEEFGRHNLGYHVWPYWREFVQGTCARMGIPPIPVPMYRLPNSSITDVAE